MDWMHRVRVPVKIITLYRQNVKNVTSEDSKN